jgi:hypothetical protein
MYHQFNIQKFYVLPTQWNWVFCVDLKTNSYYFLVQHYMIGFYNRDGVCLLRGTDWVFSLPQFNFRLSRLVAGFSSCRPIFDPRTVHVIYAMDKAAVGKIFLRVFSFPLPVSFHQCSTLILFSYQKTNEKILVVFQKAMLCRK